MSSINLARYKRIVQYFWDPEPKNYAGFSTPIWCLGSRYGCKAEELSTKSDPLLVNPQSDVIGHDVEQEQQREHENLEWPQEFLDDFESRLWFTYRSNFPPIGESLRTTDPGTSSFPLQLRSHLLNGGGFTSDTGWGCMIRSGQCLLANALAVLHLGRDWRRGTRHVEERRILALFADDIRAPFSIHRFVEHGASACGKYPGEWFGPSATARCIHALSAQYSAAGLNVYMAGDGADIYQDSFLEVAVSSDGTFTPTLILVGIRLGIDRVTPSYWPSLRETLRLPQSIGIAGGRPSSSHYFLAVQGDTFFYLDPHTTRAALPWHEDGGDYTSSEINSCHTRRLRRLRIEEMDPSMLIGFLIKDHKDWKTWRNYIEIGTGKPIFNIQDHEPVPVNSTERENSLDQVLTFDDESDGEIVEQTQS